MTQLFVASSLIAVWSAMAVYTLAFIMFTLDLAKRSAWAQKVPAAKAVAQSTNPARQGRGNVTAGIGGSVTTLERVEISDSDVGTGGGEATASRPLSLKFERIALWLTVVAWLIHVAAVVLRGLAQGYVPWSNMFEFALISMSIIVGVFIFVQFWQDLRFLGAYVTGSALIALGIGTVNFYVGVTPLAPALQSYWLVIHVFVASLGTAFFSLGAGLSIVQLLQSRQAAAKAGGMKFLNTLPGADALENLAYRVIVVGFVFWTFTLIAGAIWAERAWGRYWGWDTKEVWTFIVWTIFAGYLHARATRGWRGPRSAWLAIIGFATVVFNFTAVNLFFKGLHAYSGLVIPK